MDVPPYHDRFYISDLTNDFQEITPLNGRGRWYCMWIRKNCIYTTKNDMTNLYATNVTYDGKHLIFNQFRQPLLRNIFENTEFTGDETPPSCLAHHMGGPELIGVADTRFLWIFYFITCKDEECPITKTSEYFKIFVEQDFLICSGDGQGWTWNRPKVEKFCGERVQMLPSDTESNTESDFDYDLHDLFND